MRIGRVLAVDLVTTLGFWRFTRIKVPDELLNGVQIIR